MTVHCQGSVDILPAMVAVGLMAGYYVYNLIDADGVVRYVGRGPTAVPIPILA
jgi:hypothetical protein